MNIVNVQKEGQKGPRSSRQLSFE